MYTVRGNYGEQRFQNSYDIGTLGKWLVFSWNPNFNRFQCTCAIPVVFDSVSLWCRQISKAQNNTWTFFSIISPRRIAIAYNTCISSTRKRVLSPSKCIYVEDIS